jgi:hypothetical protein
MQYRNVLKRYFWRGLRIDAQRARKDPRARKSLMLRFIFLIYLVAVGCYYGGMFYSLHDPVTAISMAALLLAVVGVIVAVRISQWREEKNQLATDIASVSVQTTAHVQRLAHGLAAVTERALGEVWLTRNKVPEGHTVVTRRITIDALRAHDVWDEMPTDARAWMMSPDGSWPQERVARVLQSAETLNTMLWALALLPVLRRSDEFLGQLSFQKLARALKKPAPGVRPTWDLRVERNPAWDYFWRCYTEAVYRGNLEAFNDEQHQAIKVAMAEIEEEPQGDILVGASTVHELETDGLFQVLNSARMRANTLNFLMNAVDGDVNWEEFTGHVYNSLMESKDSPTEIEAVSE